MCHIFYIYYVLITPKSPAKTAELIDFFWGGETYMCPRKQVLNGGTFWCHLADTTERSLLGGNAFCCYQNCNNLFSPLEKNLPEELYILLMF